MSSSRRVTRSMAAKTKATPEKPETPESERYRREVIRQVIGTAHNMAATGNEAGFHLAKHLSLANKENNKEFGTYKAQYYDKKFPLRSALDCVKLYIQQDKPPKKSKYPCNLEKGSMPTEQFFNMVTKEVEGFFNIQRYRKKTLIFTCSKLDVKLEATFAKNQGHNEGLKADIKVSKISTDEKGYSPHSKTWSTLGSPRMMSEPHEELDEYIGTPMSPTQDIHDPDNDSKYTDLELTGSSLGESLNLRMDIIRFPFANNAHRVLPVSRYKSYLDALRLFMEISELYIYLDIEDYEDAEELREHAIEVFEREYLVIMPNAAASSFSLPIKQVRRMYDWGQAVADVREDVLNSA